MGCGPVGSMVMNSACDRSVRSLIVTFLAGVVTCCGASPHDAATPQTAGAPPPVATNPGPPAAANGPAAVGPQSLTRDANLGLPDSRVQTTYEVKYTPKTLVLDEGATRALKSADPKSHRYTFDAAALGPTADKLKPGTVLLIPGKALRKVTRAERVGSDLVVDTAYAALTDAIESGKIGWNAHLSFDRAHAVALVDETGREHPLPSRVERAFIAGPGARVLADSAGPVNPGAIAWSFKQGPMTYEFSVEPQGEQVSIKIKATKQQGPKATLAYTAVGTFKNVYANADGTFADSQVKTLTYDQPELVGDVTLSMAAAGAGLGKIDFPFPGVMFKFVVMVGPVPITIGVGAKLIGSIVVPAKASAAAKSRFRYQSSSGFEYQGSDVEVTGNIGNLEFSPDPFDSAAMINIPVDAQWGVAFPRISVSVFDSLFVPYLHTGVVVGSSLKWGPVCKHGYVKYTSEVGYDFKVFGVTLKKDKVTVAEKQKLAPEGGCP